MKTNDESKTVTFHEDAKPKESEIYPEKGIYLRLFFVEKNCFHSETLVV